MILSLQFTAFDMESCLSCGCDHLTIMDGDGTTLMEKSCGATSDGSIVIGNQNMGFSLPVDIISTSNIVKLVFITDNYDDGNSGWNVSWSAVTPGECQQCNLLKENFSLLAQSFYWPQTKRSLNRQFSPKSPKVGQKSGQSVKN